MYTRWSPEHINFIKNNLKISDFQLKEALLRDFGFDVTEEAVKKKRQRLLFRKKTGRKKKTIEAEESSE